MRRRTGDWRDLLSAYSRALDFKKLYVGLCAVFWSVVVLSLACALYAAMTGTFLLPGHTPSITEHGALYGPGSLLRAFLAGNGLSVIGDMLPLLCPLAGGGLGHFALSVLLWAALLLVWSGPAGIISRLVALEYGRDDLPTLREARQMLSGRRKAYFLAPLTPLIFILVLLLLNVLGGFIAAIVPWIGRLLFIIGTPMMIVATGLALFLAVFGVLAFGMMFPAVSVSGKDAFESFTACYAYVLWGLRRLICYTLIAAVVGVISTLVVGVLAESTISIIDRTVGIGFFREAAWITYDAGALSPAEGLEGLTGFFGGIASAFVLAFLLLVRLLPAAYAFVYFFAAYTVIFLLMRKDQDNIEIDEIYEEVDEEEEALEEPGLAEAETEVEPEPEPETEPEAEPDEGAEPGGEANDEDGQ